MKYNLGRFALQSDVRFKILAVYRTNALCINHICMVVTTTRSSRACAGLMAELHKWTKRTVNNPSQHTASISILAAHPRFPNERKKSVFALVSGQLMTGQSNVTIIVRQATDADIIAYATRTPVSMEGVLHVEVDQAKIETRIAQMHKYFQTEPSFTCEDRTFNYICHTGRVNDAASINTDVDDSIDEAVAFEN